ncbi:glycosyltransferase family 8 protein [Pedobacter africanus]|uniref:Lipopolysaccharide biosynthesis protein, LPS:glycosyltransferase n=1 Tax=Pedobacter africanus TaxID=151894 RepID=A0A1W2DFX7_9SPHI|nr:glycosyltransferase family 8 protein [Pedobacter africanus]SMC96032.1 Lipopolysaccharide biosynthesis protein, LPS:glycosyltransferase [Pedobacter africanus]
MKKEHISIVVASDNHYSILIAALLKSIDVNHHTDEHIDFHIIDDGISSKTKEKIQTIADPSRITIKWFNSKKIIPDSIVIPVDNSAFPLTVYLRVFSPYVVDKDVEKLIYLDVDTIVQDDISKLWNTPLGDYIAGAVQDVGKTMDCEWGGVPNYKELGFTADTKYFNSGVLMINAKRWREENYSAQVISALSKYKEHVRLADQYGLNVVLANKWLELDPKWNWFAFKENEDPSIVHFLDIKPIFTSYNSKEVYREEFFRYLSMTPWKNFKPISGNKRNIRKIYNKIKKAFLKL